MGRPAIPVQEKPCRHCGSVMPRKRFRSGQLEERATYARRIYCDRNCMAAAMEGRIKTANPKNSHRQSSKAVKSTCEACGRLGSRLHVHHVDENPMNNEPPNLMTLCGSCHRQSHSPNFTGMPPRRKPCLLCTRPAQKRGYCWTHTTRIRKHGDPLVVRRGNGSGTRLVKLDS